MKSAPREKTSFSKAGVTLALVVVGALVLNSFLVYSVLDGKRLIEQVEAEAGRELSGYELYSDYREVDSYYYPERKFQGNALYWFNTTFWGWIAVSLAASLSTMWSSGKLRAARWTPFALMLCLLGVAITHSKVIEKIAGAVE